MAARKRWPESATGEAVIRDRVEAALEWISENPIVPNHEQAIALCQTFEDKGGSRKPDYCDSIRQVAVEWQKRMFLSPEEDDPDPEKTRYREALEKLAKLGNGDAYGNSQGNEIAQEALGIDKRNLAPPQKKLPLQCGERLEVRDEIWEAQTIVGLLAVMKKVGSK